MSSSSTSDYEREMLDKIGKDAETLAILEAVPEQVAQTVRSFTPRDTGRTVESITVKSRRTALRKLGTRRVTVGTVYSDDDPERVGAIEYGRNEGDEHGGTPAFHMFLRAALAWDEKDLD